MKFREHRGSREDSLKTEVDIEDHDALVAHLQALPVIGLLVRQRGILIEPYGPGEAETWIVRIPEMGVLGFITR